ncbi:MAG: serine/threonine-protein kinase [Myxococcota bacterium]
MSFNQDPAPLVKPTIDLESGEPYASTAADLQPISPTFVDRQLLGRGGTAMVYRVFDTVLRRHTALKVLPRDLSPDRFLREARVMAQLEHPHIVPVHGYGVNEEGSAWINMALVNGRTLSTWVADLEESRLEAQNIVDGLDILDKVCDAVAYAHSTGVLHLDIKPANVMVSDFGRVLLMDWGISQLLNQLDPKRKDGKFFGTPAFVAPEQVIHRDPLDARTDVYALGGLLRFILTGKALRQGASATESIRLAARGHVDPIDPSVIDVVHPGLITLIEESLSVDPSHRPPSASHFQHRLRSLRRGAWRLPTLEFDAGAVLIRRGDEGHEAYVIVSGEAEVRNEAGELVRVLGSGDVFGELAVLSSRPRSMDVVARTPTQVHVVTRADLEAQLRLASWSGAFVRTLVDRFAEAEARGALRESDADSD